MSAEAQGAISGRLKRLALGETVCSESCVKQTRRWSSWMGGPPLVGLGFPSFVPPLHLPDASRVPIVRCVAA